MTASALTHDSVMLLNHLDSTSINVNDIKNWTNLDPTLLCVRRFDEAERLENTEELDKKFHPYFSKKEEFDVLNGCVLCGCRVVVPPPGIQLIAPRYPHWYSKDEKSRTLLRMVARYRWSTPMHLRYSWIASQGHHGQWPYIH